MTTTVPDLRPSPYLPPATRLAECARHILRLRAVQRACQVVGDEHGAACAGERLDVLLTIWRHLDELARLDGVDEAREHRDRARVRPSRRRSL